MISCLNWHFILSELVSIERGDIFAQCSPLMPAINHCQNIPLTEFSSTSCLLTVSDWKSHKARCKAIAADIAQADSHEIHKREFDLIRTKYGLSSPENAEKIANMLADTNEGVSAPKFAEMFGMSTTEAVVFLEWIKVGIKFKEETLDTAKKAGFGK